MHPDFVLGPAGESDLDFLEQHRRYDGLMHPLKRLSGRGQANDPGIERVAQHLREPVDGDRTVVAVSQAPAVEVGLERLQGVPAGGVELERRANERPFLQIDGLRLSLAVVDVPERCSQGVEALLETAIEAFAGLFAKVADEVRRDHGLDVGGEPAAAGREVERLVAEVHLDAEVDELADLGPVLEVAGAPVDLVDDDAGGLAGTQLPQHRRECRPAELRGRHRLFEPFADVELVFQGVALDRRLLLLQRNTLALLQGGDAYVSKILLGLILHR